MAYSVDASKYEKNYESIFSFKNKGLLISSFFCITALLLITTIVLFHPNLHHFILLFSPFYIVITAFVETKYTTDLKDELCNGQHEHDYTDFIVSRFSGWKKATAYICGFGWSILVITPLLAFWFESFAVLAPGLIVGLILLYANYIVTSIAYMKTPAKELKHACLNGHEIFNQFVSNKALKKHGETTIRQEERLHCSECGVLVGRYYRQPKHTSNTGHSFGGGGM